MLVHPPTLDRQQATLGSVTLDAVLRLTSPQPGHRHLEHHVITLVGRQSRIKPPDQVQGLVKPLCRLTVLAQPQVVVPHRPQQPEAGSLRRVGGKAIELGSSSLERPTAQEGIKLGHPVSECSQHRDHVRGVQVTRGV